MLTRWLPLFATLLIIPCCLSLLLMEPLEVGSAAPDLTLPSVDGGTVSLDGLKGRPVLLNFWSTT